MFLRELKTNGYKISENLEKTIKAWREYLVKNLGKEILKFYEFYYTDKLVFADVELNNKHYAQYTIRVNSIHFNGHTCNEKEYEIFSSATYNDSIFKGKIKL